MAMSSATVSSPAFSGQCHEHGTHIYVLEACQHEQGGNLVAIAGESSVEILHFVIEGNSYNCARYAVFTIGVRATALAWSPRTVSPSISKDEWFLELAVATAENDQIHLIKSPYEEVIRQFGGGMTGHRSRINDICFCGGMTDENAKYVATVSDDHALVVWDLDPSVPDEQLDASPAPQSKSGTKATCFAITFLHPLTSVDSHPSSSKDLVVSDSRGAVYIVDWQTTRSSREAYRNYFIIELAEPKAMADGLRSARNPQFGSVAWRKDKDGITIGGAYGSRYAVWGLNSLSGGQPYLNGVTFPEGGRRFRWCSSHPDCFAVSPQSPEKGGQLAIYQIGMAHIEVKVKDIVPASRQIRDFDFLRTKRPTPLILVSVGRAVLIVDPV